MLRKQTDVGLGNGGGVFAFLHLSRDRHLETERVQRLEHRPRLLERARAAARVVPIAVRIVDADAKRDRLRLLAKRRI